MTEKAKIELQYEYASLNRKIIAFGIDIIIITLVLSPILNLLMMIFFGSNNNNITEIGNFLGHNKTFEISTLTDYILSVISSARWLIVQFIMLLLVTAYFVYFWVKVGAAIGR